MQHAIDGLGVTEGCLSTAVDLTKQMNLSFALPPCRGSRGHATAAKPKEGRKVCVCVYVCVCVCVCVCVRVLLLAMDTGRRKSSCLSLLSNYYGDYLIVFSNSFLFS